MNPSFDLFLLTESRYLAPTVVNEYISNVLTEDRLVLEALIRRGLRVQRVDWADPTVDWQDTRAVLFRTTWDYFDQFPTFRQWMASVSEITVMMNPAKTIRWNMDKHYLGDLASRGVNIPPTIFMESGDPRSLQELQAHTGWEDMILKPCVSGGAKNTFRLDASSLEHYEQRYRDLIAQEAFMLQPLQHDVLRAGELSLMVIGGTYTHAVKKIAKPGDFRVQDDWGGTVHPYSPSAEEIAFAERAIAAVDPLPVYARVDIIRDNDGQLAIMELELIEPEMWFRLHPAAADLLAEVVVGAL